MKKKIFLITIFTSLLTISGCNILYSNKIAPVFSKQNLKKKTPPEKIIESTAIENPNNKEGGINIRNEEKSPYNDLSAPFRPNTTEKTIDTSGASEKDSTTNTGVNPEKSTQQTQNEPNLDIEQEKSKTEINQAEKSSSDLNPITQSEKANPITEKSATKALLQEAKDSLSEGNYDKAVSALERAHRIEPRNAKILYDISQIRYAQGKYRQAESFSSKAASYSSTNNLSKKIWNLLSDSRRALGNITGAEAAANRADNF